MSSSAVAPLSDVMPGFLSLGLSKRQAVETIVEARVASQNAREPSLTGPEWQRAIRENEAIGEDIKALVRRIDANRRRRATDVMSEEIAESRSVSHHYASNIHE